MSHYKTLGVTESSSTDEIKKAYKKLARKYHPDVNSDPKAEETFKKISEAYSVISDPEKRQSYDAERKMQASGLPPGFGGFSGFGGFDPFSNFMGGADLFEGLREAGNALNIRSALQITFLEARDSQVKPIKFQRKFPCTKCQGTGVKEYHANSCPTCRGRGNVSQVLAGMFTATKTCQTCRGKGKLVKTKCSYCQDGSNFEVAEINVHIPAGMMSGKVLRLQGEGHRSIQGKGDLLIRVTISPDPRWEREGANIHTKLELDYPTLVLGGEVEVETIWGRERVQIPPRTKSGTKLALHNKGFPRLGRIVSDEHGIHYINVELKLPTDNSKKHIELLKDYKKYIDDASC